MKRALFAFSISFVIALLLLFSSAIRNVVHRGLILTLYVPLLRVEATLAEMVQLQSERERLIEENFGLLEKVMECVSKRLDTLWSSGLEAKAVRILALDPLGVPWRLVLAGGKGKGFRYGNPVLQRSSLVGRISSVGTSTSTALTLFNPSMRVGVADLRSGILGVVRGGLPPILQYVPKASDIQVGDTLVTSGLGGMFPRGIPVAVVSEIETKEAEMFLSIKIQPLFDFTLLGKVEVLVE